MTSLSGSRRSSTFRQRITVAAATLGIVAALQGGFAIWAVGQAEHHVMRGRIAADIKQGFTELWFNKQQLRTWLTERQFGATASDEQRDALLLQMRGALDNLDSLAEQSKQHDPEIAARRQQEQRRDSLVVLRISLDQLARGLANLNQLSAGLDTASAWRAANEMFDNAEGRDLRKLLAEILAREDASLREKRSDTNNALFRLRQLWIATTATLVLAALLLAFGFARALRMPLVALADGASALRTGQLSHRIKLDGADEFGEVARSMNAMAEELSIHRAREIEERQALEDQVARRTNELTAALDAQNVAEKRRRQLFADISHELRTPTTAIRGEAQVALRGEQKPAEDYKQSLRRIEDATQQLGATIDDLLTMARSDIDLLSLRRGPIDLVDVLNDVLSLGTAMAKTRDVSLASEPWPPRLMLRGDADRLKQVYLVLIDNAIRYSHPGGTISLVARRVDYGGAFVEVEIADDGIGIDSTELIKVFDRGYRAPNAQSFRSDGSGLGLPIALALARGHGGDITLRSTPGKGTVAVVVLPLTSSQDEKTA